ncbi:MAG: hypothetical protein IRY91_13040 [Gemmatimonadaceae bacterium]|nr:hypothetical protein [Gemmatimonadaceae bacterium]
MPLRRVGGTVAAAMLASALGACGHGERAAARGPYAKDAAEAIPMIERATGLRFKREPVIQSRTKAQVRAFLEQRFKEALSDQEITGQEILYRRLGLLPDTFDLRKSLLDLLTEQVIGFYDPKTKVLYVVEGAPREQVGLVVSHELVHALQDQYMNLDSLQDVHGDNDRAMAAQAVIEGEATLAPIQAALGPGAALPAGWDRIRDMIRENQSTMPVFAAAPFVLQETLVFPYLSGAEFMRRFRSEEPGRQPYGPNMPVSTEQILHQSAYFGAHRDAPTEITLPKPATGSVLYEDNLGEFETRLFLFQHLHDQNAAVRGAAGWDGDRYQVIRTPRGDAIVWLTVWDSQVDAAEFESDVEQVIANRFHGATAQESALGKRYTIPAGRTIRLWGGEVAGRPAVLYEDLPDGVSPTLLDLKRVTLR